MERQAQGMNVRPQFLREVGIFFVGGLLVIAYFYFDPHINLPRPPKLFCPLLAQLEPLSKAPVRAEDSLELVTLSSTSGTPYTVRIYGDGRVERDTVLSFPANYHVGCPLHEDDKHLQIPAAQANALITQARDGGFCRLCRVYQSTHATTDGDFNQLTLTFYGKTNTVANSSRHPPPLFTELLNAFSTLPSLPDYATTHYQTRERMLECNAYFQSQMEILQRRSKQH
jgi:hypothetical protein